MGKFIQTTYKEAVENITEFNQNLIDNPFYKYNQNKPILCTYYNINKSYSTLDEGTRNIYDNIGTDSPLRYNRIYDVLLYSFDKIQLQTNLDEFGAEAENITGECTIIPNEFIPMEGDYFSVSHIKDQDWLFIVKDVQKDTLPNNANAYRLSYRLEYDSNTDINNHVVANFKAIEVKEGTNIEKVVRIEDLNIAELLEDKCSTLKEYFCNLFYDQKVQTFIFEDLTEYRIYDQYMIEFMIRNGILDNGSLTKIYVSHVIPTHNTFAIDYDKSFFRAFERCDKDKLLSSDRNVIIDYIKYYGSIFNSRYETYYKAKYVEPSQQGFSTYCIGDEFIYDILDHKLISNDDLDHRDDLWKNILIKFFYNEELTYEEIASMDNIKYEYSKNAYYMIPLLIFCLEKYEVKALSKGINTK